MDEENFIYIAFDEKMFDILGRLHSMRMGEYIGKSDEITNTINNIYYFDNILDLIYQRDIRPYVLDSVKDNITEPGAKLLIKEFGFSHNRVHRVEKEIYNQKRNFLATSYCHPFKYKGERYSSAFDYDYENNKPEDNAVKVADASLSDCLLVVFDEDKYIHKEDEAIKNQRTLGIMVKNCKNKIFKWVNGAKWTPKPMSIWNFGPKMKQGIGTFNTETPNSISNRVDVM